MEEGDEGEVDPKIEFSKPIIHLPSLTRPIRTGSFGRVLPLKEEVP